MAASDFPFALGPSRVVAGRYPPPGTDSYADAIRERRGARGITPLDANLLHVPPIAGGFNSLLGAVRTKGKLPGDLREAMILRVAAINHAAFEWVHHEHVGRAEGLSTGQLYIIRDAKTPLPPVPTVLTPLQTAAIAYTDYNTRDVRVPMGVIQEFKKQLKEWVVQGDPSLPADEVDAKVDDFFVEAAMVVASYNMVSRFLLGTDVAGISDVEVPWPVDKKEYSVSLPLFPPSTKTTHKVNAVTLITAPAAPWIVFANSLLTDWTMWSYVIPYFLDLPSSETATYNILLHSQRGHGSSTLPPSADENTRHTTIPLLATDMANLLEELSIPTPVHAVIGVSQGGAAALAFAAMYPDKTRSIVACDTGPRTPAGNKEAWEDRIRLVLGPNSAGEGKEYAKQIGLKALAKVTVPRWFPLGSRCYPDVFGGSKQAEWVRQMIESTDANGFVQGARALGDYDVFSLSPAVHSPEDAAKSMGGQGLFDSPIQHVFLIAGSLDGGGKVGKGLRELGMKWNGAHGSGTSTPEPGTGPARRVKFVSIEDAGHLPMIDSPADFCKYLTQWVQSF